MSRSSIVKRLVIGLVVALIGLLVVLLLITVLNLQNSGQATAPPPPSAADQIALLRTAAAADDVESARSLSEMRGPDAVQAMRLVLEASENAEVKLAMVQGLGPNNKDWDSVPLLIDVVEASDANQFELRQMAMTAAEILIPPTGFDGFQWNDDTKKAWCERMRLLWKKINAAKER